MNQLLYVWTQSLAYNGLFIEAASRTLAEGEQGCRLSRGWLSKDICFDFIISLTIIYQNLQPLPFITK